MEDQKLKKNKQTLINNSDKGSLKDVDILFKITSLQCSCVKKKFKFHASLDISQYLIKKC